MNKIDEILLYHDLMGQPVTAPVMQIGEGKPHVVMTALQHGWEIIGLDTGLQVMQNCKPKGTITLISVLSPLAYQEGLRFTAQNFDPSSKQQTNINRVHPGDAGGNIAERSAYAVDQYIQKLKPDYVIDLHSYASQSEPHAIVDPCEPRLQYAIHDWMVRSQNIWYREYAPATQAEHMLDKALSAIWVNRGIPAITLELGPLKFFSCAQSLKAQQALNNALVACNVIDSPIKSMRYPELADTVWQRVEIIYEGDKSGYLRAKKDISTKINAGDVLAEVVIPSGDVVGTVTAPATGIHFIWSDDYRASPGSLVGVMLVPYVD